MKHWSMYSLGVLAVTIATSTGAIAEEIQPTSEVAQVENQTVVSDRILLEPAAVGLTTSTEVAPVLKVESAVNVLPDAAIQPQAVPSNANNESLSASEVAPSTSSAIAPLVASPEEIGTISQSANDLQANNTFSFAAPQIQQESQFGQLLLAQEVDLELLCRSFPLNSRCRNRPVQTTPPPITQPTGVTTTTTTLFRPTNGFYASLSGALQFRQRSGESATTYTDFNSGYAINGALGYRFGNVRAEGELSYMNNSAKTVASTATGPAEGIGNIGLRAIMFNAYYDIPIENSRFKPYVGAGLGFYNSTLNGITNVIASPAGFVAEGTSPETFAFQLRAGASYVVSRELDVFLGYRYFDGGDLLFENTDFGTLRPSGAKTHSIELGVRGHF